MGGPSPEKGPGNRRQLQIDTTQKRLKAIPFQMPTESSFAVNRTVVTARNFLAAVHWAASVIWLN
jgi:hypothetical protein